MPGNSAKLFSTGLQAVSVNEGPWQYVFGTLSLFYTRGPEGQFVTLGMSAGSFQQACVPDMDMHAPCFTMVLGMIQGR